MNLDAMVVEKAQTDVHFRNELKANPREAIRKHFGVELPEGVELKVSEDTDQVLNLVLPPVRQARELSANQLQAAAGGRTGPIGGCKGCTTGSLGKKIIATTIFGATDSSSSDE